MTANAPALPSRRAKAPPFLLLAALLFWGWQLGMLPAGAIMGLALESARYIPARWELTNEDFRRICNFCLLLSLAAMVYAFTTNDESGGLRGLLHASTLAATHYVGTSATRFLRWQPITFFLFIAAQMFSETESIPWSGISWFARRRQGVGGAERYLDASYPYFCVCLFSAGIHPYDGSQYYFWGEGALVAWALWPMRSRRFGLAAWMIALAAVIGVGFSVQRGVGLLQRVLESYNAQWAEAFLRQHTDPSKSETAIGSVGQLKLSGRIVIRIEPKSGGMPLNYLREASYLHYKPEPAAWYSGGNRNDFSVITNDAGTDSSWTILLGKTNDTIVNIAAYLNGQSKVTGDPEGLLPLPSGVSRLEKLPVFSLKTNNTGAVLAAGLGLVAFDAHYGVGATFDSPPDAGKNGLDLSVPTNEMPALDEIIAGLNVSNASDEQKRRAVSQFFSANFTYTTWLGSDKLARTNETALSRFLLQSRSGHCEYFATATVLLLRELGIPARYAVGYFVHEPSRHGYVVRERDAHAWCLVWNSVAHDWEDFDTTPASWVAEEGKRASVLEWFSDLWSQIRFQIAKLRWGQTNLRLYILWGTIPVLALLLYQILFRRGRRRRAQSKTEKMAAVITWPGLDSQFYLIEPKLAARGVPRQSGETLSDWLARILAEPELADLRAPLRELLPLHYRHRFDPRGLSRAERESLNREARTCLEALSRMERRPTRQG